MVLLTCTWKGIRDITPEKAEFFTRRPLCPKSRDKASRRMALCLHADNDDDEEEGENLLQHDSAQISAHRSQPSSSSRWLPIALHLTIETLLLVVILFLLFLKIESSPVIEGHEAGAKNTLIPKLPRKTYVFSPNATYLHAHMFASEEETLRTLHDWIPLSSKARGYVSIPDWRNHNLSTNPYIVSLNRTTKGPGYMITVMHQLHCLSYLVHTLTLTSLSPSPISNETAYHATHCFDYLRQGILCAGDTTFEGQTDAGPGWGSVHECVDYDALLEWADEHGAEEWRGTVPGSVDIL